MQRRAWDEKPLLREIYSEWFEMIADRLSTISGPTIELGSGIGGFKEFSPDTTVTDLEATPWTDEIANAERLGYADSSLANLVMIDVLHHLPHPRQFFDEAARVLQPGGRVVMVEPYCSPLSGLAYRYLHHEGASTRVDPLDGAALSSNRALDANNAVPTLVFWRHLNRFRSLYPTLEVVERRRFSFVLYPLSGGFTRGQLVPGIAARPLRSIEWLLRPLAPLAALRCLVVLERASDRR